MAGKEQMKKNLAIIGMAGNMKNAVACGLAAKLGMMPMDCREYIEYSNSMSAEELIAKTNITYFKKQVSKAVAETADLENVVFCSCDLTLLSLADLRCLKEHCYVIGLRAKTATVMAKYSKIKPLSALLQGETPDKLNTQSQKRYAAYCDFAVDIDKQPLAAVVNKILDFLKNV